MFQEKEKHESMRNELEQLTAIQFTSEIFLMIETSVRIESQLKPKIIGTYWNELNFL